LTSRRTMTGLRSRLGELPLFRFSFLPPQLAHATASLACGLGQFDRCRLLNMHGLFEEHVGAKVVQMCVCASFGGPDQQISAGHHGDNSDERAFPDTEIKRRM